MKREARRLRRQKIAKYVGKGNSFAKAAAHFGVRVNMVRVSCREFGVIVKDRRRKCDIVVLLADLLNTGDAQWVIADRHGVLTVSVNRLFRRAIAAGIRFTSRNPNRKLASCRSEAG